MGSNNNNNGHNSHNNNNNNRNNLYYHHHSYDDDVHFRWTMTKTMWLGMLRTLECGVQLREHAAPRAVRVRALLRDDAVAHVHDGQLVRHTTSIVCLRRAGRSVPTTAA